MDSVIEEKPVTFLGRNIKGISGSTIKLIAIITMLIDHSAATIIGYLPVYNSTIYTIYVSMRNIGRIAFPCFCFLLIEGFIHTRSRVKYAIRLALFALISEIPFDLALNHELMDNSHQNVFFTLFIGFVTITLLNTVIYKKQWNKIIKIILALIICAAGLKIALVLKTDYDAVGVLTIIIMYLLRNYKTAAMYGGCMTLTLWMLQEAYAFIGMIPIALYNGTRGFKLKYFFYIFYPAHLLILYAICKVCELF
ncbi:TraX family protein [Anaerosporobacter sp.]